MSNVFEESMRNNFKFEPHEENYIDKIKSSVEDKVKYDLRRIYGFTERVKKAVRTNNKNEYGDYIEDWDKLSTKQLINFFSEGNAHNFYATPVKMQSFIESSLSDIIFKHEFNQTLIDPENKGTVAVKTANAELMTMDANFANTYRKLYKEYATEVLKTFDRYLSRLESIIKMKQFEEKMNPNKNPF